MAGCLGALAAALLLGSPCFGAGAPPPSRTAGSGGEWKEAPGYEVSIVGDPEMQARVYQSRDYRRLLVRPDRGAEVWVVDLVGSTVAGAPMTALRRTTGGINLDETARQAPRGSFTRAGAEISFQAGKLLVHLAPQPPLVGEVTLETILVRRKDYLAAMKAYRPDSVAVAALRSRTTPAEILVFFGTWCSNCKRWLPGFMRSMELAANPRLRVRYLAMDEEATQPKAELAKYKVHTTPSFIVVVKGVEAGRIAGQPRTSVERDLVGILSGAR